MKTQEINLNKRMGGDERDTRFCVLREKALDKRGLFPSADFEKKTLSNTFKPVKLIYGNGVWAIGEDDTRDIAFYEISTGSSFGETYRGGHATDDLADAEYYFDGTDKMIYGLDKTGDVFSFHTDTYVYTHDVHTSFATGGQYLVGYHSSTDALYYVAGYNLYKQTQTTFSGSKMSLPQNYTYKKIIEYKDWILIIAENNATNEIKAFFWDVINEPSTFDYKKTIGAGNYLAGGVLEGEFTCVISTNDRFNTKEGEGGIQIKQFKGSYFKTLNSIKSVSNQNSQTAGT